MASANMEIAASSSTKSLSKPNLTFAKQEATAFNHLTVHQLPLNQRANKKSLRNAKKINKRSTRLSFKCSQILVWTLWICTLNLN
jgi:hypothetical protein